MSGDRTGVHRLIETTNLDRVDLAVAFDLSGWVDMGAYLFEWGAPTDISRADVAMLLRAAADDIEELGR